MSRAEAVAFLAGMIHRLKGGYHPDTAICDYVRVADGVPTFSRVEAEVLQAKHDQMMEVLGEEVYTIGLMIIGGETV